MESVGTKNQDLIAWQLASEFHEEICALVEASSTASRDFKFRDQLLAASGGVSKHIAEGYLRCQPLVFANFLDYALGSIGEAEDWIKDGTTRGHWPSSSCEKVFQLARRCLTAAVRLKQSQLRYAAEQKRRAAEQKKRSGHSRPS